MLMYQHGVSLSHSDAQSYVATQRPHRPPRLHSCRATHTHTSIPESHSPELEVEAAPIASGEGTVRFIDEETQTQGCVLLIDNLDSFTLNIAHAIAGLGRDVLIYKARDGTSDLNWDEEACVEFVRRFQPTHIVLGPGPGEPTDSPLTMSLLIRPSLVKFRFQF